MELAKEILNLHCSGQIRDKSYKALNKAIPTPIVNVLQRDTMKIRLSREFKFDAAHRLENYNGVCARIHGHTYTLVVTVEGEPDDSGMLIDFFDMKKIVEETVISKVDHTYLNDFYQQPTVENMAQDMFENLKKAFEKTRVTLFSVKLYEGLKCCAEVFA